MIIYVLLGSDEYVAGKVMGVYASRKDAESDIKTKAFEYPNRNSDGETLLCRQSEPRYDIVETSLQEKRK